MKSFEKIYQESKAIEALRERTYHFEIDPLDRAWIIMPNGEILSDVMHSYIFRSLPEWVLCEKKGIKGADIEEMMINRLMSTGGIKAGELNGYFYANLKHLNTNTINLLSGFGVALINAYPDRTYTEIRIESDSKTVTCTIQELANDYLFENEDE